jgi:hypothetical protein
LAVAIAIALILVVGIVVIIRDRQGRDIARVNVPEGGSAQSKEGPRPPKQLQVSWEIKLYRPARKNDDDLDDLGQIGQPGASPRQHDRVAVVTKASEPAFWYLLAINPDGSLQVLEPEPEKSAEVQPTHAYRAPSQSNKYYTLDDAGFQGLVLLASRQRMPDFEKWRPSLDVEAWKRIKTDVAWRFNGQDIAPVAMQRVGVSEHGPGVLADLCRRLQSRPEGITVRATAFPVRAK